METEESESKERKRTRDLLVVDLRGLGDDVDARCKALGMGRGGRSRFVTTLIRDALNKPSATRPPRFAAAKRRALRVSDDAYVRLRAAADASNAESISEYLEHVAQGPLPIDDRTQSTASVQSDVIKAISESNAELRAIGRNINQIARSLNTYPGQMTAADRDVLRQVEMQIAQHVVAVSKALLEIRPPRSRKKKREGF